MCSASEKMSRRASKSVKRPRQQQGEEEDAQPAPLHLTAHPTLPLPLLSVAQSLLGMCVWAQLCDAQGGKALPCSLSFAFRRVCAAPWPALQCTTCR